MPKNELVSTLKEKSSYAFMKSYFEGTGKYKEPINVPDSTTNQTALQIKDSSNFFIISMYDGLNKKIHVNCDFGWKFHISIDDTNRENLAQGWDCVRDILIDHDVFTYKVVKPDVCFSRNQAAQQFGKQITIYTARDKRKTDTQFWKELLKKIDCSLEINNINRDPNTSANTDLKFFIDGRQSRYISYRNDFGFDPKMEGYIYIVKYLYESLNATYLCCLKRYPKMVQTFSDFEELNNSFPQDYLNDNTIWNKTDDYIPFLLAKDPKFDRDLIAGLFNCDLTKLTPQEIEILDSLDKEINDLLLSINNAIQAVASEEEKKKALYQNEDFKNQNNALYQKGQERFEYLKEKCHIDTKRFLSTLESAIEKESVAYLVHKVKSIYSSDGGLFYSPYQTNQQSWPDPYVSSEIMNSMHTVQTAVLKFRGNNEYRSGLILEQEDNDFHLEN